jgi:hypothetical protein
VNSELFTQAARAKDAGSWAQHLAKRLQECGELKRVDILEDRPRDTFRQRRYRARFERDQLRVTSLVDQSGLMAHVSWETD